MDRLDYASDTVAMAPKGPLVTARTEHAATGDANFGYFGGGQNVNDPNGLATIDRVDYSNDTVSASPKGSLSVARQPTRSNKFSSWSTSNYCCSFPRNI